VEPELTVVELELAIPELVVPVVVPLDIELLVSLDVATLFVPAVRHPKAASVIVSTAMNIGSALRLIVDSS
jgi:hypothetical protein